ncbi:MAG: anti-sigma factor [Planctomycetota bacterium]
MDCSEARELISGYAVNALTEHDRCALEEHLQGGCARCQSEIDSELEAVALLADSLTPVSPNPDLKARLLDRVATEKQTNPPPAPSVHLAIEPAERQPAHWNVYLPYVAATVTAIAFGALISNLQEPTDDARRAEGKRPDAVAQWQRNLEAAEQAFGAPQAQLIGFDGVRDNEEAFKAFVFYDKLAKQLHIYSSNLPAPPDGTTLWLWILDDQGTILSGHALRPLDGHRAASIADSPGLPTGVSEVMISAETDTNLTSPSGAAIVRAQLRPTL